MKEQVITFWLEITSTAFFGITFNNELFTIKQAIWKNFLSCWHKRVRCVTNPYRKISGEKMHSNPNDLHSTTISTWQSPSVTSWFCLLRFPEPSLPHSAPPYFIQSTRGICSNLDSTKLLNHHSAYNSHAFSLSLQHVLR